MSGKYEVLSNKNYKLLAPSSPLLLRLRRSRARSRIREGDRDRHVEVNRSFARSPKSLFQSKYRCEIFAMLINISFNINDNSDPYQRRHTQTRFEIDVEVIRNDVSYLCRKFKSVLRVDELTANKTTKQNYTQKAGSKLLEPQLVCVLVLFCFVFIFFLSFLISTSRLMCHEFFRLSLNTHSPLLPTNPTFWLNLGEKTIE